MLKAERLEHGLRFCCAVWLEDVVYTERNGFDFIGRPTKKFNYFTPREFGYGNDEI